MGVFVGGGGGVGVKPADAGAGCQTINTKAATLKIKTLRRIRRRTCLSPVQPQRQGDCRPRTHGQKPPENFARNGYSPYLFSDLSA
jgi:hypothetical protein